MKEQVMAILEEYISDDIDLETCDTLIDDGYIDSFDVVSLVGDLNDTFDVNITVIHLLPEHFNSVDAIVDLITSLR